MKSLCEITKPKSKKLVIVAMVAIGLLLLTAMGILGWQFLNVADQNSKAIEIADK